MFGKILLTCTAFAVACVCVFGAGLFTEPQSAIVPITDDSACPVTECASSACHGFDNVPLPDGVHEMSCPEASCASIECHAWDTLLDRYHQASGASLNLWILAPAAFTVALVFLARKVR